VLRQKRRIALQFPQEAEPHLVDGGSRLTPGTLVVHIHRHRLFARWTPLSGFDSPPVFHGSVERGPAGFTVEGTVRDTRAVALLPAVFLLLCACGVTMAIAGPLYAGTEAVFLVVGILLAILFGALFAGSLHRRRPRFAKQAGELESGLDTYVRTGEVRRPLTP
jgi:uncharacterized integral membrane protein